MAHPHPPTRSTARYATADLRAFADRVREKSGGPHAYVTLLGIKAFESPELLQKIEAGLPYKAFERLQKNFDLSADELAELVQIKSRTLARRRESGRPTSEESDRLLRACRVFAKALILFDGDRDGAREWLATPTAALAGRTPQDVACTDTGARDVEDAIGKLEHGAFA